jgi:hypothetical protein
MTNSQQKYQIDSAGLPKPQAELLRRIALTGVDPQQLLSLATMMGKALIETEERDNLAKWMKQKRDRLNDERWATDPLYLMQHFQLFSLSNIRQRLSDFLYDLSRWVEPKN